MQVAAYRLQGAYYSLQVAHTAQNTAQFSADFVTFTEEILNGKLYFLCSDSSV